jgi:iron complex outermembrane receptor protein
MVRINPGSRGRRCLWLATVMLAGTATVANAQSDVHRFNIPAERASDALNAFSKQSGYRLLFPFDAVAAKSTRGISGDLSTSEALGRLLADTGLVVAGRNQNVITLKPADAVRPSPAPGVEAPGASTVQEVVVTAQKRTESSLNVPMSMTALSGDQLARSQSFRLQDFVETVPGLQFVSYGSTSLLVIRGISVGDSTISSPVATYIDETPYSSEGNFAGSTRLSPNIDTFDLTRIEVLRGPQGTLYGANALGGLLKYVTNAPDPKAFASTVESGVNSVDGGGTGYDFHGMVNIPLGDKAALRVVGYDDYYPGYIDDPSRGLEGINSSRTYGGRVSLLLAPTDKVSVRATALYQNTGASDINYEDVNPNTLTPIYGPLIHESLLAQPFHAIDQLYNLTVNWDLGFAKLISSSSYADYQLYDLVDYTKAYGGFVSSLLGAPYGVAYPNAVSEKAYTQEIRLSSRDEDTLQWQIGGFFTDQLAHNTATLFPASLSTGQVLYNFPTNIGSFVYTPDYREYAVFANADYKLTPTFDMAVGGRYSTIKQSFDQSSSGILRGPDFSTSSSQGVFTYSTDLRWHPAPGIMTYARIASGFVPGGPNDVIATGIPESYGSSTTTNYEAGFKANVLDNRVAFEVSAFDIEWRNIQVAAVIDGEGTITNGGSARSDGVEWSVSYVPARGLTFNWNGSYTDARLTQATPASVGGEAGDRLPYAPLWQTSASANYEHILIGDYKGFVGGTWRFNGNRYADFTTSGTRQIMPSYYIVDFRAGVQAKRWRADLYVKNVANKAAITFLYGEVLGSASGPQAAGIYQPRTVGAEITANF